MDYFRGLAGLLSMERDADRQSYQQLAATTTVAQHTQFGADRRLAVAPIIDCSQWEDTNHQATVAAWACILMLHPIEGPDPLVVMEYEGLANDPSSPCATSGVVGGAGSVGPLVPGLVQ